jgi:hypothetical protein
LAKEIKRGASLKEEEEETSRNEYQTVAEYPSESPRDYNNTFFHEGEIYTGDDVRNVR